MYRFTRFFTLFPVFFLLAFAAFAQKDQSPPINVEGVVLDEAEKPLAGVVVYIHETQQSDVTDAEGRFIIEKVKSGSYHLHAQALGYKIYSQDFKVKGEALFFRITLKETHLEFNETLIESAPLQKDYLKKSQPLDVVNEAFLQKKLNVSLMTTLSELPGINTISTGSGVAKPVIRGMSFNRVAVFDAGIKQQGQQWGADHGLEIDPMSIERVEILKGPSSLIYGSDAMAGVIDIRSPNIPEEDRMTVEHFSSYRSNNRLWANSTQISANKKNYFIKARFTTQDYADYEVPAETFTYNRWELPIYDGRLKNTAGRDRSLKVTVGTQKEWGSSKIEVSNFNQHVGFFIGAFGVPRSYNLQDDRPRREVSLPRQKINHFKVTNNNKIKMGKHWLDLDLGFQDNLRREQSEPHVHGLGPQPEGINSLTLRLQTLSGNARFHHHFSDQTTAIYGTSFEAMENRKGGYEYLIPNYESFSHGYFAILKHEIKGNLYLNGGIRYDHFQMQSEAYSSPVYSDPETIAYFEERTPAISPRFGNWSGSTGLSYLFAENYNLKVNLGSSFRTPNPAELTANGIHHGTYRHEIGDPNLPTERGYQMDVSLDYETTNFLFRANPFFNYFDNYIFLQPTGRFSWLPESGQVHHFTAADAIFTGGELMVEYHFTKQVHSGLAVEYVWNQNLESLLPLPFTPPFSAIFDVEYQFDAITKHLRNGYINSSLRYTAAQNRVERNELTTPEYFLVNIEAGFQVFYQADRFFQVYFMLNNVFDTFYFNHLSRYRILNLPEPGRNFTLSVKIPIGFDI